MGTPNINRQLLTDKLTEILSEPKYALLLDTERQNNRDSAAWQRRCDDLKRRQSLYSIGVPVQRKKIDDGPQTPREFAEAAIEVAFGDMQKPKLLDPITVTEIGLGSNGTVHLYRVFDGNVAATLGRWWCDARLVREVVWSVGDMQAAGAHEKVIDYLKCAMFVHPSWNLGTDIARMTISEGVSLPAILGRGNWKAMKSPASNDGKYPALRTAGDLMDSFGMVPIPGAVQVFVPYLPAMRIAKVPQLSADWPFA
jgi:hypothetical protein